MARGVRPGRERARPPIREKSRAKEIPAAPPEPADAFTRRAALFAIALALVVGPLVFDASSRDSFRLPKALFLQTLTVLSLLLLSLSWQSRPDLVRLLRAPALRAFAPLVLIGALVSLASPHVEHVARAQWGLWIGALAIWGWSVELERAELDRALAWTLVPAAILSLVALAQFHDLYQPFEFERLQETSRLAITSLAGNAGDLAAYLVLPALVAQRLLVTRRKRLQPALALALALYGIALSQTFAALLALGIATLVFWAVALPKPRRWIAPAGAAILLLVAFTLSAPFRARASEKVAELSRGDWNSVLTGRLDGWRTGLHMFAEHPLTGVGLGAFRTEFLPAKEAMLKKGVPFFTKHTNVVFANAHNEAIEIAAELGLPGIAALIWALVAVVRRARALPAGGSDRAFAWAALAALAVLATVHFPFRIAIVCGPALLFLAWLFHEPEVAEA